MTELILRLALRGLLNPRVGIDLLAMTWAFRRREWWRTPPFLPLPDQEYLAWRLHTAYGDQHPAPAAEDVVRFARWRREILRP
jgi:hypothetical protein